MTLFLLLSSLGIAEANDMGRAIWTGYSAEQKITALAGFVHCYRASSSSGRAFEKISAAGAAQTVDRLASHRSGKFGSMILQALRKTVNAKPDAHAEHWSGPYGFATGLWWRGLDEADRQAYVQGVFWCAENTANVSIKVSGQSVVETVHRLDGWYVVADDDWKNPQSSARVDVPVIVGMQRAAIIEIGQADSASQVHRH